MSHYELWLDESGDFKNETAKKNQNMKPSMIGGILVKKSVVNNMDFNNIIDMTKYHATELNDDNKRNYVLPILENINSNYGGIQVFFENISYDNGEGNRQLYLKMMAEGLLQLMVRLNAINERVILDVIIARRQDVDNQGQRIIQNNEYIYYLQKAIEKKITDHKIVLNDKSKMNFTVKIANVTPRLILADFACNTRMTRDSNAFRTVSTRVYQLYNNALIFSMNELTSENYFRCCLAQNSISDALVELFSTRDKINIDSLIQELLLKFSKLSYRIIKSQLRQFAVEVIAIASKEDDYEIIESFLKRIDKYLLQKIHLDNIPYQYLEFNVLLCLADAYLREGDIVSAKEVLVRCRNTQLSFGNHLEDVFTYYQLIEKETLYYIDSFQYKKAKELMSIAEKSFKSYMQTTVEDEGLNERFPTLSSEYYGDALCMDIYALMFLQRFEPSLYGKLVELSDIALEQYPGHEGELERHRQYRSHIELEAGNYKLAIQYLMQAKLYNWIEPTKENLNRFLEELYNSEIEISCQYYLMYYLLIIDRAFECEAQLAKLMWDVLSNHSEFIEKTGINKSQDAYFDQKVNLTKAQQKTTHINYHPLEIILWKYANIKSKFQENDANLYYEKATTLCERYSHYVTMRVTGLGIRADYMAFLVLKKDKTQYELQMKKYLQIIDELSSMDLDEGTKEFISQMKVNANCDEEGTISMKKNAEKITY